MKPRPPLFCCSCDSRCTLEIGGITDSPELFFMGAEINTMGAEGILLEGMTGGEMAEERIGASLPAAGESVCI